MMYDFAKTCTVKVILYMYIFWKGRGKFEIWWRGVILARLLRVAIEGSELKIVACNEILGV